MVGDVESLTLHSFVGWQRRCFGGDQKALSSKDARMHQIANINEILRIVFPHLIAGFAGLADLYNPAQEAWVARPEGGAGPEGDGQQAILAIGSEHTLLCNSFGEGADTFLLRRFENGHSLVRFNEIRHIVMHDSGRGREDKCFNANQA